MIAMALSTSSHLTVTGSRISGVASSGPCSCSSSVSARPQRASASAFLSPAIHASSSSVVFRDGVELLVSRKSGRLARQPRQLQVVALFGLGVPELVVIAGVAALLFGPKKLPEIGKSLGKTVKSFQVAAKEFETEIKATAAAEAAAAETTKPEEQPAAGTPPQTPPRTPTAATGVTGAEKENSSS